MQKVKLITAVCLALFAGALMAAPEPTVPAPAVDQAIRTYYNIESKEVPDDEKTTEI